MNPKLLLAACAAVGMLVACGDDDDDNNVAPAPQTSSRPWQNVVANVECDEATDTNNLCNDGAASFSFNSDGSFNFNNGQRTGSLTADDLNRLGALADPIASQDTVQQQSCEASNSDILLGQSISMIVTGGNQPVVVYEERQNVDEVCTRGNMERLLDLRELLAEFAVKYAATASPTPSPSPSASPSPSPSPTATPTPTATPAPTPTI